MKRSLAKELRLLRFACCAVLLLAVAGPALAGVAEIVEKMPAQSPAEGDANHAALVATGSEGVKALCAMIVPPGKGDDTKARFALSGLAKYVSRSGAEAERDMAARAIAEVLRTTGDNEVRAFLIRQLQVAGRDECVPVLATFLGDQRLSGSATQALTAIGTCAAKKTIKQTLPSVAGPARANIIKAIGDLRCMCMSPAIAPFATDKDENTRSVALFALANIGDETSQAVLAQACASTEGLKKSQNTALYLLYARRLAENGEKRKAEAICREILENTMQSNIRSEALGSLAAIKGKRVTPDLIDAMDSGCKEFRMEALRLADVAPGTWTTRKWVRKMNQVDGEARLEIMGMLGRRGDKVAIKALLKALETTEEPEALAAAATGLRHLPLEERAKRVEKAFRKVRYGAQDSLCEVLRASDTAAMLTRVLESLGDRKCALNPYCKSKLASMPIPDEWNIARGKPVTASVKHQGNNVPQRAVDGNTDNGSAWHGDKWPAALDVDLGYVARINRAHVTFYSDEKRYYQYQVQVSADGKAWETVADASKNETPATATGVVHTFAPVDAQFVRVNVLKNSANEAVHLTEIKVYEEAASPAASPGGKPGKDGFVSLFNGKDLRGWTGDVKGYIVEDGAVVCKPGGNLYTMKSYDDFVFEFEFKLTPGGNNGIGIRCPLPAHAAYQGMEIQVLDDTADKYKDLHDYQFHGSIYGVVPAKRGFLKPVGEWNTEQIIADGRRVKVILNGETIVDADLDEASTPKTADGKDHPGLKRSGGHIAFCGHGDVIYFRNMKVKELK